MNRTVKSICKKVLGIALSSLVSVSAFAQEIEGTKMRYLVNTKILQV